MVVQECSLRQGYLWDADESITEGMTSRVVWESYAGNVLSGESTATRSNSPAQAIKYLSASPCAA